MARVSATNVSAMGAAPACHGISAEYATPRDINAAASGMEHTASNSPFTILVIRVASFSDIGSTSPFALAAARLII